MKRIVLNCLGILLAFCSNASSVLWDGLTLTSYSKGARQKVSMLEYGYFDVSFYVSVDAEMSCLYLTPDTGRVGAAIAIQTYASGAWMDTVQGGLVNAETMLDHSNYAFCELFGYGGMAGTEHLQMSLSRSNYLMFVLQNYEEVYDYLMGSPDLPKSLYYGWMEYVYDENIQGIKILKSAIGLEEQTMIVGGGAIPEPTAAVLLVLGAALLGLRRKRNSWGRTL